MKKKDKIMKPKTHVAIVIDRSGSMASAHSKTIEYYNEQLEQAIVNSKDQDITFSVVSFNGNVFEHEWLADPNELAKIDASAYSPQGATALDDAVGYTLEKLQKTTEADENTAYLVLIVSDGEENSSQHFNRPKVKKIIDSCEATKKWTVSYMGCDARYLKHIAKEYGIKESNMAVWTNATSEGAERSLRRSTQRTNAYYGSRARGMVACSNLYSDSDSLADFTEESPMAFGEAPNMDIEKPEVFFGKPVSISSTFDKPIDRGPNLTMVGKKNAPFNARPLNSGTAVSWK